MREHLAHLAWLREQAVAVEAFMGVPDRKLRQFAAEARSLGAADVGRLMESKRLALMAALLRGQVARALDDAAEIFVRLTTRMHNRAREALDAHRVRHAAETDALVALLRETVLACQGPRGRTGRAPGRRRGSAAARRGRDPGGLVHGYDCKPKRRLFEVMREQGLQANQDVTFLADGGYEVRALTELVTPEAEHVLDWLRIAMRLTVLGQYARGVTHHDEQEGMRLLRDLKRTKWLLWHGNVHRALQTATWLEDDVAGLELDYPRTSASSPGQRASSPSTSAPTGAA